MRKRLGARLLVERIQEKGWNESEAAAAANINPKTIRRIERGQNYEMESLEKYASALGRPLIVWLKDLIIGEETAQAAAVAGASFPGDAADAPRGGVHQRKKAGA